MQASQPCEVSIALYGTEHLMVFSKGASQNVLGKIFLVSLCTIFDLANPCCQVTKPVTGMHKRNCNHQRGLMDELSRIWCQQLASADSPLGRFFLFHTLLPFFEKRKRAWASPCTFMLPSCERHRVKKGQGLLYMVPALTFAGIKKKKLLPLLLSRNVQ